MGGDKDSLIGWKRKRIIMTKRCTKKVTHNAITHHLSTDAPARLQAPPALPNNSSSFIVQYDIT